MKIEYPKESLIGPRSIKNKESVEYHFQTVYALELAWQMKETSYEDWQNVLDEIKEAKSYNIIPPDNPYGSLGKLFKDLGIDGELAENEDLFRSRIWPHGGDRQSKEYNNTRNQGANQHLETRGQGQVSYILARLARDHPDILAAYERGEYRSARQAGIAAGFIKDVKRIQVLPDPEKIAIKLKERLTKDQIAELVRLLSH